MMSFVNTHGNSVGHASRKDDPFVAERMNGLPKIVVSKSMPEPEWSNTQVIRDRVPESIVELKEKTGGDIALLGSGQLVSSLLPLGLIDELRIFVHPTSLPRIYDGHARSFERRRIAGGNGETFGRGDAGDVAVGRSDALPQGARASTPFSTNLGRLHVERQDTRFEQRQNTFIQARAKALLLFSVRQDHNPIAQLGHADGR